MNKAFGISLFISLTLIAIVVTWGEIEFHGQKDVVALTFGLATFGTGVLHILSGIILLLTGIRRKPLRAFASAAFILAVICCVCGFLVAWNVMAHH